MLRDEDIELVRASVSMRDLAGMYGYKPNRTGKIICPFHDDKDPSMQLYKGDRGYYCFVCKEGGSIFNFVMKHDGLEFEPAVRHIAELFGIAISDKGKPLSESDHKRIERLRRERQAAKDAEKRAKQELTGISDKLVRLQNFQAEFEPLSDAWCEVTEVIERLTVQWDAKFEKLYGRKE